MSAPMLHAKPASFVQPVSIAGPFLVEHSIPLQLVGTDSAPSTLDRSVSFHQLLI
jgi:hypothetical protein